MSFVWNALQADEENAEQKTQAHNDPEVVLRQGRASSYMHGGGGRPRLVGAVKRLQTGITAQEHMATGTTNETAATKGSSAMAAALSASAAAKSPNDSAGTEDAVDLEPIGVCSAMPTYLPCQWITFSWIHQAGLAVIIGSTLCVQACPQPRCEWLQA